MNLAACDRVADIAGGFAAAGGRWIYSGALTFDNAAQVVAVASALPLPESGVIDCANLGPPADSVALAVLLTIKRRAGDEGRKITFEALPANIESLARVYGIDVLLNDAVPPAA